MRPMLPVGTKRTLHWPSPMAILEGRAELDRPSADVAFDPNRTLVSQVNCSLTWLVAGRSASAASCNRVVHPRWHRVMPSKPILGQGRPNSNNGGDAEQGQAAHYATTASHEFTRIDELF